MPKKLKGGPFGFFLSQNSKTLKGDPLVEKNMKKVAQCRKKTKGVPFGLVRYCVTRETFLVQFPGLRGDLKFCRTFGRTILVTSGVSKKNLTKSNDYSRLFSRKAPTKIE